jgi:hypothetical protein
MTYDKDSFGLMSAFDLDLVSDDSRPDSLESLEKVDWTSIDVDFEEDYPVDEEERLVLLRERHLSRCTLH